jgi:hypothetical protein
VVKLFLFGGREGGVPLGKKTQTKTRAERDQGTNIKQ